MSGTFQCTNALRLALNKALQTDTTRCHAPCIRKGGATLPCR
jgi:hypothetical protein